MKTFLLALTSLFLLAAPTSLSAEAITNAAMSEKLAVTQDVFAKIDKQVFANASVSHPQGLDDCMQCMSDCQAFPEPQRSQCEYWCYVTIPSCSV